MLALKKALEAGYLIVEHRHYRGSQAPTIFVCDSFDQLSKYLDAEVRPGDSIWTWEYGKVCADTNALTHGKKPDTGGRVPLGGAY